MALKTTIIGASPGRMMETENHFLLKMRDLNRAKDWSSAQERREEAKTIIKNTFIGSGCGSVGRLVASDSRVPWFESSHWQKLY